MHKGPIKSRITLRCIDCGDEFQAKRRDAKRCVACGRHARAVQTKASCRRHLVERAAYRREHHRKLTKERRAEISRKLRERYATDEVYREARRQHGREWCAIHGTVTFRAKAREYHQRNYATHKQEQNRKRMELYRAQRVLQDACAVCGLDDPRVLIVHHKVPLSQGGTSERDNLKTLCRNCHAMAHYEMRRR